jgi:hypothetical protein
MLRLLMAVLMLVTGCGLAHAPVAAQQPEPATARAYKIERPGMIMGWYHLPGSKIDVISIVRTPRGETVARLIVTRVEVVRAREHKGLVDLLTLKVTPTQATILERTQRRGVLAWSLTKRERATPVPEPPINGEDLFK